MDTAQEIEEAQYDDDRPVIYHDMRLNKHVGMDPRIIDGYLSIIGFDGLGLLMYHYHMASLPEGTKRKAGKKRIKAAGRVGLDKLNRLNEMLVDLGFIHQVTPDTMKQSRHIASHTFLLDPPAAPSAKMIEKYRASGYENLSETFYRLPSLDLTPKPAVKAGTYLGTRSKSGYPDGYPVDEAGTQMGTRNGKTGYPDGYPKVHSLTHSVSSSNIDDSKKENLSERVNPEASVMESDDDAREKVQAVQLRLMVALQGHGWMGGGWTWSQDEQALIADAYPDLSQQAIEYAVATWMETVIKGKRREPFHPSRTLPWLIKVCKNFDATKGFYEYHGSTNGTGTGRRSAEQLVPPAHSSPPECGEDDEPFDYSLFGIVQQ